MCRCVCGCVCMCIYVCTCRYVCVYMCVYLYVYACVYVYVCIYLCSCVYMHVRMYVCVCKCMHVCAYVNIHLCMCVCMYVCACVYVSVCVTELKVKPVPHVDFWFRFVSSFYGISTLMGYLKPTPSLKKDTIIGRDKEVHAFPRGIKPKVRTRLLRNRSPALKLWGLLHTSWCVKFLKDLCPKLTHSHIRENGLNSSKMVAILVRPIILLIAGSWTIHTFLGCICSMRNANSLVHDLNARSSCSFPAAITITPRAPPPI